MRHGMGTERHAEFRCAAHLVPADRRHRRWRARGEFHVELPGKPRDCRFALQPVHPLEPRKDILLHPAPLARRRPAIRARFGLQVEHERATLGVLEKVGDAIPPQPEQPVDKARRDEQRHRTVELGEDGCGDAGEIAISVVHCEGHGGWAPAALLKVSDHVGQAEEPVAMATEVRQVIAQGSRVVPHYAQVRVCEPMEREDRHEAAPEGAERRREYVRAHHPGQEGAGQARGHISAGPPGAATLRPCSPAPLHALGRREVRSSNPLPRPRSPC